MYSKIEVFNKDLDKVAILQNAYGIEETITLNGINRLIFTMPCNDSKIKYCKAFNFIKFNENMYRILPSSLNVSFFDEVTFECEHVIATLIDDIMYGDIVIGNIGVYTTDVINFVLGKQTKKLWKLGVCEFSRQFEYGWSHESLLSALFSIPNRFVDPYIWEFDTITFPWTVNLRILNTEQIPQLYIRKDKNILNLIRKTDPTNICTRLYAHGYGEGVNALTFAEINDGKPYIESPQEIIDEYGLKTRLWVDRRYEDKKSLLEAARTMLNELQNPGVEYSVDFVEVDETFFNKAKIGKIAKVIADGIEYKTYITEIRRSYSEEKVNVSITIANKPKDIASSVADLADRQRIEMTYAQGATQIYSQSMEGNSDQSNGTIMDFYIPQEMKIINSVKAKIRVSRFRAFSKATEGGGGQSTTSSSGGGESSSTTSGGGSTATSEDYDELGSSPRSWTENADTPAEGESHRHRYTVHLVSHKHNVKIPSHSHDFTIRNHTHSFTVPSHTHNIEPGIYFFGSPNKFSVYVNGELKKEFEASNAEIDLTQYLVGDDGLIPRGVWQSLEIRPDSLAYVSISMFVQGFIQSRGDATV